MDTVKLRDAQNAVLRENLRRKFKLNQARAWNPQGRGVVAARRLQRSLKVKAAASPARRLLSNVTPNSASSERLDVAALQARPQHISDELR